MHNELLKFGAVRRTLFEFAANAAWCQRCSSWDRFGERLRELGDVSSDCLRAGSCVAFKGVNGGSVVSGIATAVPSRTRVQVTLDGLACRLRENAAIEGFHCYPRDIPPERAMAAWSDR
jgi:hypothetical protein